MVSESIDASGHEHVSGRHSSTLELTTDSWLTEAGDCIIGINATKAPASFDDDFIIRCQDTEAEITLTLRVGDHTDVVTGHGHPELTFQDPRSLVVRTSTYVDDRTVMVRSDKAAADLDRSLIAALSNGASLTAELTVD